jgi:predicted nucleic acid-binding protein
MDWLVDTGVLLRLVDTLAPDHLDARRAVKTLRARGDKLLVAPQNVAEFWNVSTRPQSARGGYGRSLEETERCVAFFERYATVLPETPAAYSEWRRLVTSYGVSGVAVYDARLVAVMLTSNVPHVLTLNPRDFERFEGVVVSTPADI